MENEIDFDSYICYCQKDPCECAPLNCYEDGHDKCEYMNCPCKCNICASLTFEEHEERNLYYVSYDREGNILRATKKALEVIKNKLN